MQKMKISIVIAVYNEEKAILDCLDVLINQDYPKKDYEIVVVNDGSTDNTKESLKDKTRQATLSGIGLKTINFNKNKGRVIARKVVAEEAKYNNILFIDSRCSAQEDILKSIKKINHQPLVGNPVIDHSKSIWDRFNWLFRKKLYYPYYGEKYNSVYITKHNFDKIGKGTGIFFCNKQLFLSSQPQKSDHYVSDDTSLLWNIVQKKRILKHSEVKAIYQSRVNVFSIIKHTFQRGPKFVDYYLSFKKRRFWLYIFLPLFFLISMITSLILQPHLLIGYLITLFLFFVILSFFLADSTKDFLTVLLCLPLVGVIFESGIVWGIGIKVFRSWKKKK